MTTAAARLVHLAGTSGAAGELLALIGAGTTAASRLVAYSGLGSATAAAHLMTDVAVVIDAQDTHDGGDYSVHRVETKRRKKDDDVRARLLEAYAQAITEPAIAVRAAEIVMPHQVAAAQAAAPYIPPAEVIDWASVAADLRAIEALIVLAVEAERMRIAKLAEIGQQNELLCLDLI